MKYRALLNELRRRGDFIGHFILDEDGYAKPATAMEYVEWTSKRPRPYALAETTIGPHWISTVFLGIDPAASTTDIEDYEPLVYETLVCSDGEHRGLWRWRETDCPLQRHGEAVKSFRWMEETSEEITRLIERNEAGEEPGL